MTLSARNISRDTQEVRRAQILEEAVRVIAQRGCYGFRIQELAQRCGLSNAGLLYHFGSREEILLAVLDDLEARESQIMRPLVAAAERTLPGKTSRGAVLDVLRVMVTRASARPQLIQLFIVLQAESIDPEHPAYAWWRNRDAVVLDLFTRLVTPYVDDPRSTARMLVALMDGLIQHWLRTDQSFDLVAEWERALAIHVPEAKAARIRSSPKSR